MRRDSGRVLTGNREIVSWSAPVVRRCLSPCNSSAASRFAEALGRSASPGPPARISGQGFQALPCGLSQHFEALLSDPVSGHPFVQLPARRTGRRYRSEPFAPGLCRAGLTD